MEKRVTASEVTAEFEALVEAARERGETLVVERNGKIICRIVPETQKTSTVADFVAWLERTEWPDPDFGKDLQAAIDAQTVEVPRSMWD